MVVLSGTNTYTGGTTLTSGTLGSDPGPEDGPPFGLGDLRRARFGLGPPGICSGLGVQFSTPLIGSIDIP